LAKSEAESDIGNPLPPAIYQEFLDYNIASRMLVAAKALAEAARGAAIPLRDVKIGVKKIEWMSVKNPNRGWGRLRI